MKLRTHLPLGLLIVALAAGEIACARLAYWTICEITSGVILFAVIIGNVMIIALALVRLPRTAAVSAGVLALLVIPYQLYLGHRLLSVQKEADSIVTCAQEQKLKTGRYPADLSGYPWRNPSAKPFIEYDSATDNGTSFLLLFFVGTESTSHFYSPGDGWNYYPD